MTNESQLQSVTLLIQAYGVRIVINDQWNHLDGLIKVCFKAISGQAAKLPQKIAACDLIAALGEHLRDAAELVVPTYQVFLL